MDALNCAVNSALEANECWHISNVTDRSAASNVGVSPFTMPMSIDAKTNGRGMMKIIFPMEAVV